MDIFIVLTPPRDHPFSFTCFRSLVPCFLDDGRCLNRTPSPLRSDGTYKRIHFRDPGARAPSGSRKETTNSELLEKNPYTLTVLRLSAKVTDSEVCMSSTEVVALPAGGGRGDVKLRIQVFDLIRYRDSRPRPKYNVLGYIGSRHPAAARPNGMCIREISRTHQPSKLPCADR